MFCSRCGSKLVDGALFCSSCGARQNINQLNAAPAAEVQETQTQQPEVQDAQIQQPEVQETQVQQPEVQETQAPAAEVQETQAQQPAVQEEQAPAAEVQEAQVQQPEVQQMVYDQQNQGEVAGSPVSEKKKSKKTKIIIIAAGIVVLLCALGFGGFYLYANGVNKDLKLATEAFKTLAEENVLLDVSEFKSLIEECEGIDSVFGVSKMKNLQNRLTEATEKADDIKKKVSELRTTFEKYKADISRCELSDYLVERRDELIVEFEELCKKGKTSKAEAAFEQWEELAEDAADYTKDLIDEVYSNYYWLDLYKLESKVSEEINTEWTNIYEAVDLGEYLQAYNKAQEVYNDAKRKIDDIIAQEEAERLAEEKRIEEEQKRIEEAHQALVADGLPEDTVDIWTTDSYSGSSVIRVDSDELFELTEVNVNIEEIDASELLDEVYLRLASGETPGAILVPSYFYERMAGMGYFDITNAWNDVADELDNSEFVKAQEALRMKDGRLYGITTTLPYSHVMYVRRSWLDQLGLREPSTYEEFEQMLMAFTENAMGEYTEPSQTYGMLYVNYASMVDDYGKACMAPFLWNAENSVYTNELGENVDGFAEQGVVDALNRLKKLADAGAVRGINMEDESLNYDNFYNGECGVIMAYEGMQKTLEEGLASYGIYDEVIPLAPFEEMGSYKGVQEYIFMIPSYGNVRGIIKYVLARMLDGEAVQSLWTYGSKSYEGDEYANDESMFTTARAITPINQFSVYNENYETEWDTRWFIRDYFEPVIFSGAHLDMLDEQLIPYREQAYSDIINYGVDPAEAIEEYKLQTADILNPPETIIE